MSTHYLLDLSRLLHRAGRAKPTGIDRVELAYAMHLVETAEDHLNFAAMTYDGRLAPLPFAATVRFLRAFHAQWQSGGDDWRLRDTLVGLARSLHLHAFFRGEAALMRRERRAGMNVVYLLVSHHHLDRPAAIQRLKRRAGVRFVCLIHDLIPIEFPEYARPGQADRHRRRMETVAHLADGVIFNSDSTSTAFRAFLPTAKAANAPTHRLAVAPLGIEMSVARPPEVSPRLHPYFVCVGTIEPKKNHLLLLNLWRRLAAELGSQTPHLVLIGRRGWENENVIDMIERSTPLQGFVEEYNNLNDIEMHELVLGARALLLPSFAEGYGLPIAEALALGAPVLCSDLPALREVGKDAPEYLDPLDGPAWRQAVIDYADARSPRRAEQLKRLASWSSPTWSEHFSAVQPLLDEIAASNTALN